jgi:hypothetical protein
VTSVTIHFPLPYTITGRLVGKSVNRTYAFSEMASFDIPHVPIEDAPIAVEWAVDIELAKRAGALIAELGVAGPDGRQHTRFHNGRHWVRLTRGHDREVAGVHPALSLPEFAGGVVLGRFGPLLQRQDMKGITPKSVDQDASHFFDSIRQSGREAAFATIDRLAEGFIAVDGVLYMACQQPSIWMAPRARNGWADRLPVVNTNGDDLFGAHGERDSCRLVSNSLVHGRVVPLTMFDEAVIKARRDADNTGMTGLLDEDAVMALRPVIHLPHAVSDEIERERRADDLVHRYFGSGGPLAQRYFSAADGNEKLAILLSMPEPHRNPPGMDRTINADLMMEAVQLLESTRISLDFAITPTGARL